MSALRFDPSPTREQMFHEETLLTQLINRARHRPTFEDMSFRGSRSLSSNPCSNGSQPPRSADRRLRVGPGRPAGCPRRTPGEARRRKFVFWFGEALVREFGQTSDGQTKAGLLLAPVGTPCLKADGSESVQSPQSPNLHAATTTKACARRSPRSLVWRPRRAARS